MKEINNNKNEIIQSQMLLYRKLKKLNQLFITHFSTLFLFLLITILYIILWSILFITGYLKFVLAQRYGVFGIIVTLIQISILYILLFAIGMFLIYYGIFLFKGTKSLKQDMVKKETQKLDNYGIVPYITHLYTFLNRYSKEKFKFSKLIDGFFFFNIFSFSYVFFLISRLIETVNENDIITLYIVILFLSMLFVWIISFITAVKIRNEIKKWENIFPILDKWAQELEQNLPENSIKTYEEGDF